MSILENDVILIGDVEYNLASDPSEVAPGPDVSQFLVHKGVVFDRSELTEGITGDPRLWAGSASRIEFLTEDQVLSTTPFDIVAAMDDRHIPNTDGFPYSGGPDLDHISIISGPKQGQEPVTTYDRSTLNKSADIHMFRRARRNRKSGNSKGYTHVAAKKAVETGGSDIRYIEGNRLSDEGTRRHRRLNSTSDNYNTLDNKTGYSSELARRENNKLFQELRTQDAWYDTLSLTNFATDELKLSPDQVKNAIKLAQTDNALSKITGDPNDVMRTAMEIVKYESKLQMYK